jgi:hypothetical protein
VPGLETSIHLDMYRRGKQRRTLRARVRQASRILLNKDGNVYGMEWGDPESMPPLTYVRDHYLLPYVTPTTTAVEIGPGGGRWTRYLLGAERVYAVDFHQELLDELKSNYRPKHLSFVKNNGNDFPGLPVGSIDFVFSFGTFVHLDIDTIDLYLRNIKALLKPSSNVVIHYSDKSKPLGKSNVGFSQNDPDTMRALVTDHGFFVYEEDLTTLWHSAVIRFGTRPADVG